MSRTPVLTTSQMRAAEQAIFATGLSEYELMERAGAAAAEIIWRAGGKRELLVLCGPGNNGGDGFVVARLLQARGVPVRVAVLGESRSASSRTARAGWGGPIEPLATARPAAQVVDALFGTGLSRGLDAEVADRLNILAGQATHSYAIDLPSGVETDSGAILSAVPRFDLCIALGALKPAHLLFPSADCFDRLVCADIGIVASDVVHRLPLPAIEAPTASAHKYRRGLVAVVGGEMHGAGLLAARAAAHSGAGMIRHMLAKGRSGGADAIVALLAADPSALARVLRDDRFAAALVGPGLGRDSPANARLAATLRCGHPLVLDADALTLLADDDLGLIPAGSVLTPHEGEFLRLFGDLPGSKIDRTLEASRRVASVVVAKGADTVIAAPDGRAAIGSGASTWLSTAGTGDVLAGLIAGRLAVSGDAFRAACEAVWLQGEAARRAGAAFIADDLIMHLPAAIACRL